MFQGALLTFRSFRRVSKSLRSVSQGHEVLEGLQDVSGRYLTFQQKQKLSEKPSDLEAFMTNFNVFRKNFGRLQSIS